MRKVLGICTEDWIVCGQNGSPAHGAVMSCQSLTAQLYIEPKAEKSPHYSGFTRSVRFGSESRSSTRLMRDGVEYRRDTPGHISLTELPPTPGSHASSMSQSAPAHCFTFELPDTPPPIPPSCRFPKLEECAHFHYERVALGGLRVELVDFTEDTKVEDASPSDGWVSLRVRSHVSACSDPDPRSIGLSGWADITEDEWTLVRDAENFLRLDDMLHRCIYDRKVSGLPDLSSKLTPALIEDEVEYRQLISDYVHHLSIIADDSINCGPILNWLQMDNKGHKLLVASEDSSSINTPAVAAAYSVRKYVSQARDEISFEVGDMISIIDMPGPQESLWWRGKRGFRVGFFPRHCVAVIGDKVPRHMTQPPPIVGSVAMAPIKPVLRKHGKLISLFRSFILSRPSRRSLKQQGILRERVFGCDLGEHLLNCGKDVPEVVVWCSRTIEARGAVDGVYRLSGGARLTQRLRATFDAGGEPPDPTAPELASDPHAVAGLLKMYCRELPNPLCTYQLYESFVSAVQLPQEEDKLLAVKETVVKLPPPHYRTLAYLMRHLRRVSLLAAATGMTARNMAIVWAPNLLRSPRPQHALHGVAVQAVVTEFLICYAEELFAGEQAESCSDGTLACFGLSSDMKGTDSCRRPKSLPVNAPTKLLSLEEAQKRGGGAEHAATPQLRPSSHLRPKYIEVGLGPNNLPQYHTVIELPSGMKRGIRRPPAGWKGLFSRGKRRAPPTTPPRPRRVQEETTEESETAATLRPAKSCDSVASDGDTVAPLPAPPAALRQHARSTSCDSYFEAWRAELAGMRLRLAPQERRANMFADDGDAELSDAALSSAGDSSLCSPELSPAREVRANIHERKRGALEEKAADLSFIDVESPRGKRASPAAAPRASPDLAKRLCMERDSAAPSSAAEVHTVPATVKLRDRGSPRKFRNSSRYSGMHQPIGDIDKTSRLSWHGKDHSTLIKIDWPIENSSVSTMTTSTLNSSPMTPSTPVYDVLDSDSETSDANKHTIKINCGKREETCLKCELNATDYEASRADDGNAGVSNAASMRLLDNEKGMSVSESSVFCVSPKMEEGRSRPSYISLRSSSDSSSHSPLKSPLKSTISITFRSPTRLKTVEYNTIDADIYEDVDVEKSMSIVEKASVPQADACLPTQEAFQPECDEDLIVFKSTEDSNIDVYSKVKFFKKSVEEVNALVSETPKDEPDYENIAFPNTVDDSKSSCAILDNHCDQEEEIISVKDKEDSPVKVLNVRELATKFESPTELKQPFSFEPRSKNSDKCHNKEDRKITIKVKEEPLRPLVSPRTVNCLARNSTSTRSLDENAFVREFGGRSLTYDLTRSRETKSKAATRPAILDLNPSAEETRADSVTPTTENKISLIQRFDKTSSEVKTTTPSDFDKSLSRERIEKYKEERRNFLREKYGSQSFRCNPEQLTRLKLKKEIRSDQGSGKEDAQFERRNTMDLGQRMRLSLVKGPNDVEVQSTTDEAGPDESKEKVDGVDTDIERCERISPSYNIRDMAAIFEHITQRHTYS